MKNMETNCEKIGKIWKKAYLFTIQLTFLPYFSYLFTFQLAFLPFCPNLITIQLGFLPYLSYHFYHGRLYIKEISYLLVLVYDNWKTFENMEEK
jgi:hypothetical protein